MTKIFQQRIPVLEILFLGVSVALHCGLAYGSDSNNKYKDWFVVQREDKTNRIVAFTRSQFEYMRAGDDLLMGSYTIDNEHVLALFSHNRPNTSRDQPLFVLGKMQEPTMHVYCTSENVEIRDGEYPQWSADFRKLNDSQFTTILKGFGGDGGDGWSSIVLLLVSPTCEIKELYRVDTNYYCDIESENGKCEGETLEGRFISSTKVEITSKAVDDSGTIGKIVKKQTMDLVPFIENKK